MSTTRKIEGYLTAHDDNGPGYELGNGAGFGSFWEGDATKFLPEALPVTLVIGGKCLTEEEHEAELLKTREVVQALVDALRGEYSYAIELNTLSNINGPADGGEVERRTVKALALAKSQLQIEPTKR